MAEESGRHARRQVDAIRFGIPSIDGLFGETPSGTAGIHLPRRQTARAAVAPTADSLPTSVSICISGPGGTGKSILSMHLASRYLADCRRAGDQATKVFYVSTDLKYDVARSVWQSFGLAWPNRRLVPFQDPPGAAPEEDAIELLACHPLQSPEVGEPALSDHLLEVESPTARVFFVDLASNTAGDDWGFVSRLLSVVERRDSDPPHLLIVDSVEGFETLVGERDAFGEFQSLRSRVAQILRSAGDKSHVVFIVEEPKEGEHLPEEFVADVVIRLRSVVFRDYGRRTIEIVKSRGQAHVRGQHIVLIRSGAGSTTGNRVNHDDPELRLHGRNQSYVHVCPSLHHLNRQIMTVRGYGRPAETPRRYAAFGIRYLDSMLGAKVDDFRRDHEGCDQRGLLSPSVTALIGNSQTRKSPLGYAFLSRCFRSYVQAYAGKLGHFADHPEVIGPALEPRDGDSPSVAAWRESMARRLRGCEGMSTAALAAALDLGPPREERDGIPVLLTTHDLHAEALVAQFLRWLLRKVPVLQTVEVNRSPGCLVALRLLMAESVICRRLEIHDMPSAVLVHILQRSIEAAQRLLFGGALPEASEERYRRSWGIRVVIDDLSVLRDTYAEVRDDPLLLRGLVFLLVREGVTTLLIDTQEGHPNLTIPSHDDSELRSLVDGQIYTWRFPFYDGNRVAISAAFPEMMQPRTVIRELRKGTGRGTGPDAAPLVVDPHFELYSGIETGQPRAIPLVVRLYEEMPAFAAYIATQDARCRDLFTPSPEAGGEHVVFGVPDRDYDHLCELASTQRDTLLDHALILQVDEFWAMKPRGIRRSGAARPMWDYLNAKTWVLNRSTREQKPERVWAIDPFAWWQRTMLDEKERPGPEPRGPRGLAIDPDGDGEAPFRRADDLVVQGYVLRDEHLKEHIDRVPFTWDFGFLLCRIHAWEDVSNRDRDLHFLRAAGSPDAQRFATVADVWSHMPLATRDGARRPVERPSWRVFLEACYQLAKAQTYATSQRTQAFDLYASAPPGLSCLVLEIWASEILRDLHGQKRDEFLAAVERRHWRASSQGLIDLLSDYDVQLFRTWLLLVEVLDLQDLAATIIDGRPTSRQANPSSLAVRHWYKTAFACTQDRSVEDPLVPAGLPGHFSVRGDWFLAVAGGSRSERLADQALDFFNTRSAAYERLRCGLGLPVRHIVTDRLRTGIITLDRGDRHTTAPSKPPRRVSHVHYENLICLGGPVEGLTHSARKTERESFTPADFHWFWRSRLAHFASQNRVWHQWLARTVVWWARMREVDGGNWINGFQRYDELAAEGTAMTKAPPAWSQFRERCQHLIRELEDAAPA